MIEITDEYMEQRLSTLRAYTTVLLKKGPAYTPPDTRPVDETAVVNEHGRRNMALQAEGKLSIVGPVKGGGEIVGLCIFAVLEDEVRIIMDGDGAIAAGIFVYEIVTLFAFPGDKLL